jgi:hypothetical protein
MRTFFPPYFNIYKIGADYCILYAVYQLLTSYARAVE